MHEDSMNLNIGYKSNHGQNAKTASKNTTTISLVTARLTYTLQSQQADSYNNNKLQSYHATKLQRNDSHYLEMRYTRYRTYPRQRRS